MQTPPGWYRDPTSPSSERWWDGSAWSSAVRAAPSTGGAPPLSGAASRTRTIAAVAGVVVVLVALIVAVAVVRDGGTDEWRDVAETSPAEVPQGGTDFLDSNGAYAIHVADQWEQAQFEQGAAWYTGTGDPTFRDNVVIIVEDLPQAISLERYVDVGMRSADARGVHFDEQSRTPIMLRDGGDAFVIDTTSEQQGLEFAHRLVVAVRDRVAVTVTFTSQRARFDSSVAEVDRYLRTLAVR